MTADNKDAFELGALQIGLHELQQNVQNCFAGLFIDWCDDKSDLVHLIGILFFVALRYFSSFLVIG